MGYRGDLRGDLREYFIELKVFRWSGVVSAEFYREYITLQGRPHNSQLKSKSHIKFTELDINASQAC